MPDNATFLNTAILRVYEDPFGENESPPSAM